MLAAQALAQSSPKAARVAVARAAELNPSSEEVARLRGRLAKNAGGRGAESPS